MPRCILAQASFAASRAIQDALRMHLWAVIAGRRSGSPPLFAMDAMQPTDQHRPSDHAKEQLFCAPTLVALLPGPLNNISYSSLSPSLLPPASPRLPISLFWWWLWSSLRGTSTGHVNNSRASYLCFAEVCNAISGDSLIAALGHMFALGLRSASRTPFPEREVASPGSIVSVGE